MASPRPKSIADRIEIVKKCEIPLLEGKPDERILERTIHNPDRADIGKYISRLHAGRIIEIGEVQEHSPVYEGPEIVVEYVPTGYRRISFVVIEEK